MKRTCREGQKEDGEFMVAMEEVDILCGDNSVVTEISPLMVEPKRRGRAGFQRPKLHCQTGTVPCWRVILYHFSAATCLSWRMMHICRKTTLACLSRISSLVGAILSASFWHATVQRHY